MTDAELLTLAGIFCSICVNLTIVPLMTKNAFYKQVKKAVIFKLKNNKTNRKIYKLKNNKINTTLFNTKFVKVLLSKETVVLRSWGKKHKNGRSDEGVTLETSSS